MVKNYFIDKHGQLILELITDELITLSAAQTADIAYLLGLRLNQEMAAKEAIARLNGLGFLGRLFFVLLARGMRGK